MGALHVDLDAIIDLDRYPIHRIDARSRTDLVAATRAQMDAVGCCRLSDFVRPEAIESMRAEAVELHDVAFWAEQDHNPYASADDPSFPSGHPRRFFQHRTSGFINSDRLPPRRC